MDFQIADAASEFDIVGAAAQPSLCDHNIIRRKHSYVWKYFRAIKGTKSFECVICNSCVGKQTSNLARHLAVAHDISKQSEGLEPKERSRGRTSRSFIWKYCTKENAKHARCHLCDKLLYFGGGNTANIAKHLHRKHFQILKNRECLPGTMDETSQAIASIDSMESMNEDDASIDNKSNIKFSDIVLELPARKERKGSSYVWNYCDKLSRNTIRCKLCSKVMSFHGTANVITHLQRKHNILGKLDENNASMDNSHIELNISEEALTGDMVKSEKDDRRQRRSAATMSVVWKYCTRIDKDVVRCGFCNKNLSYQGTSNLQRHLHRMHGVATQSRVYRTSDMKDGQPLKMLSNDLIWEHCIMIDDEKLKCNMCNAVFECKDMENISKHLTMTHSVMPPRTGRKRRTLKRPHSADETSDDYEEYDNENWSNKDEEREAITPQFEETNIKKDESFYDDIIEEEHDPNNYEEDPFDPSEIPVENPLSPQSSRGLSPDVDTMKLAFNSKKLQRLNEERVQMETEYFREKAGYYRMQKYLTALQAKKIRLEMERINAVELNGSTTTYTMDVATMQQNIHTQ